MQKLKYIIGICVAIVVVACQSEPRFDPPYTVAFYNVENLFDTIDAPLTFDEDFLPDSPKKWNTEKYDKKLDDLAKVIYSIDTVNLPILLGVCEIENDIVLNDLIQQNRLQRAAYKYVWKDGPDFRGIDCALIYNSAVFSVINTESIPVICPTEPEFITRDILYVEGKIQDEIFHVFVNHWPSRRGGADSSEPKRILAASVVRRKVDSIIKQNPQSNIIIIGDMNDEPENMSLTDILVALPNNSKPQNTSLINLMYDEYKAGRGSYKYRDTWNMLDNIIVSGYMINKPEGLKISIDDGKIFSEKFMTYTNSQGAESPNRTYGRSYYGGISDHYPVYFVLK